MINKIAAVFVFVVLLAPSAAFASTTINLSGGSVIVTAGQSYTEPGYSANSSFFGDVTGGVSASTVNTSAIGNTTRTYSYGPDFFGDNANASRSITVIAGGGGSLNFCSGPLAPGYIVGAIGGGCGQTSNFVQTNQPYVFNGINLICTFSSGCMVPIK